MDSCPICYDDIPPSKNKVITDCNHVFCFTCLIKTVQADNGFQCPICRNDWDWDSEYSSSEDESEYEPDFPDVNDYLITQEALIYTDNIQGSQCANRNPFINFWTARYKSIINAHVWLHNKYNRFITWLRELSRYRTVSAIQLTLISALVNASVGTSILYNLIGNCVDIYNSNFRKSPTMLTLNILLVCANYWAFSVTTKVIQRDMYYYRFQRGQWHG